MDWSKGFTAEYYMAVIDPVSWTDGERIEILDGSVSHTNEGLMESANVTCTNINPNREQWVRIWMNAIQGGDIAHQALFTGLINVPQTDFDGSRRNFPLECFSVLKPADDILLQRGWYVTAGADGAKAVKSLLDATPAPSVIDGIAPRLQASIIAEDGETNLTMVWKILQAIDWRLRIAGDGTITICPNSNTAVATFGLDYDMIEPQVTLKDDWFSCPNVFRAVVDNQVAIARDETEGMLSVPSRGREIWMEETDCNLNSTESLGAYAYRRLKEEQTRRKIVSYTRRYDPSVYVTDSVQMRYPEQGLDGIYQITSQSIALGYGAYVDEEVQS